jgi:excisionase family DNA binding protein
MATATVENVLRAGPEEEESVVALEHQLRDIVSSDHQSAKLIGPDGQETEIPASVLRALMLVTAGMAQGLTMTLVPHGKELTTQQAADILHVSRPHVIKLLERQEMSYHYAGKHRRIRVEDVLAYRQRRNAERRRQLQELTELSEQAVGGYE